MDYVIVNVTRYSIAFKRTSAMTTLEVVEAVQRSLENEGFLQVGCVYGSLGFVALLKSVLRFQVIRAQLRSNVLRIISSGPDYTPQVGKAVALTHNKQGNH